MWNVSPWTSARTQRCVLTFLQLLFLVNVFRAFSQSFTCDEAFTYTNLVGTKPLTIFRFYDANNHALHTYLCCISVKLFGLSKLSMRLPCLLGCLLYYTGVYQFSRWLFDTGWQWVLSVLVLTANPFLEDFLSIARGYGLGLAFFTWSLYAAVRAIVEEQHRPRYLAISAFCLALSVAANLVFLFPGLALAGTLTAVLLWRARQAHRLREAGWELIDGYAGPGFVVAFVLLILVISRAEAGSFYVGTSNTKLALLSLAGPSLLYQPVLPFIPSLTESLSWLLDRWVSQIFIAAVLLCIAILYFRRRQGRTGSQAGPVWPALLVVTICILICSLLVWLSHAVFHLPYPEGRTGLYALLLIPLGLLLAADQLRSGARWSKAAGAILQVALAVIGILQLGQIDTRYYISWKYDASTESMLKIIDARERGESRKVRIGGTWLFEPSINFYREYSKYSWMGPVRREEIKPGFDYYLLANEDSYHIDRLHLRTLWADELSGSTLAVPQ